MWCVNYTTNFFFYDKINIELELNLGVKLALSHVLPVLVTYTSCSNLYALISVSRFTVLFANSPVTTTDTAIIRKSCPVVFLQISQNSL